MTNGEIGRWVRAVLLEHDTQGKLSSLTPHGAKATLLAYLARYGASPTDRLILGHHSVKQYGALETYSRDLQSGPLRVLQQMIGSVRAGTFHPDETRSGIFQSPQTSEVRLPGGDSQTIESRGDSAYVVTPAGDQIEEDEQDVGDREVEDPFEPSVVEEDFHLVKDDDATPDLPDLRVSCHKNSGVSNWDWEMRSSWTRRWRTVTLALVTLLLRLLKDLTTVSSGPSTAVLESPGLGGRTAWSFNMRNQRPFTFFPRMTTMRFSFVDAKAVVLTGCSTILSFKAVGGVGSVKLGSQFVRMRLRLLPSTEL